MGLFDKVFGGTSSKEVTLSPREAFAGVLIMTIAGDGYISDEEKEGFIAVSNRMQLFKSQPVSEFNTMMDKLFGLLHKHGPAFLLEKSVASIPDELRPTAFAVAADLVFADGNIEDEEKQFIEKLGSELRISQDLALKIIEVLAIKNRG
jgi:tellurite resistance protein